MFDRVYVINLDRRPERWEQFQRQVPADWPYPTPERFPAVDGSKVPMTDYYHTTAGAWGCYLSHRFVWEMCLCCEHDAVLVLEDDAIFGPDAVRIMRETMDAVPPGWEQVYFGGQHLDTNARPPECLVPGKLVRCRNVNRTHAYAITSAFARTLLDHLDNSPWPPDPRLHHVDYRMAELHDTHQVYAPWRFCIGQARGDSDVRKTRGRPVHTVEHWWNQFPIVDPVTAGVV